MRDRFVLLIVLLLLSNASPALAQLPTPPTPWTPPVGIPAPPLGITDTAGTPTHYVNCTTGNDANGNGTPATPRATIPSPLPAGSVVEVRGNCTGRSIVSNGTSSQPAFIKGAGGGACTSGNMTFTGAYLIVEDMVFDRCRVQMGTGINFFVLRRSIVRNFSAGGSGISPQGTNLVFFANEIHNNGDPDSASENDVHGIKPDSGDANVWFVDNHVHHNGGDAIQIGDAGSSEPWVHHVYVGRNHFHHDRENAVDVKRARDVIVSENDIHDYVRRSSSAGEGTVTHDNPERVWFVNNRVYRTVQGIVCTGATGYYVIGNVIYDIAHDPGASYDPNSIFASAAIHTRASSETYHVNNTMWNVDSGFSLGTGTSKTEVVNNIIGGLRQASHHIALPSPAAQSNAVISNNLLAGDVRLRLNGGAATSSLAGCTNCQTGDPAFVGAASNNFRITAGSPAANNGVAHQAFTTFSSRYGLSIARDMGGITRPMGAWDIGAFELVTSAPSAPTNFRVVGF